MSYIGVAQATVAMRETIRAVRRILVFIVVEFAVEDSSACKSYPKTRPRSFGLLAEFPCHVPTATSCFFETVSSVTKEKFHRSRCNSVAEWC